jgi:hypothetical protein
MNLKTITVIVLSLVSFSIAQTTKPMTEGEAREQVDRLRETSAQRMEVDPKYQELQKALSDAELKLKEARKSGTSQQKLDASSVFTAANKKMEMFKTAWNDGDSALKEAIDNLETIKKNNAAEAKAQKAAIQKSQEEATQKELAARTFTVDDCVVIVSRPVLGIAKIVDAMGTHDSADEVISIEVTITNKSENKKKSFHVWRAYTGIDESPAHLADDIGNSYKRISFGIMSKPVGSCEEDESIYPGKSVKDILIFESPVNGIKSLNLTLPKKNLGGTGVAECKFIVVKQSMP